MWQRSEMTHLTGECLIYLWVCLLIEALKKRKKKRRKKKKIRQCLWNKNLIKTQTFCGWCRSTLCLDNELLSHFGWANERRHYSHKTYVNILAERQHFLSFAAATAAKKKGFNKLCHLCACKTFHRDTELIKFRLFYTSKAQFGASLTFCKSCSRSLLVCCCMETFLFLWPTQTCEAVVQSLLSVSGSPLQVFVLKNVGVTVKCSLSPT